MSQSFRWRPVWAEIDLEAVRSNIRTFLGHLDAKTGLMAVVKADGYGHGAVPVAKAALESGASCLGVACIEEAVSLREAGITAPVVILTEITKESAATVIEHDITPTLCSDAVAEVLDHAAKEKNQIIPVHIKIDTGMNRLGVRYEQASAFIERINGYPNIKIIGIFTHFATADSPDDSFLNLQLTRFEMVLDKIKPLRINPLIHAANSAAALKYPNTHFDMVRIGIGIYGLEPFDAAKDRYGLKPVMTLKSKIGAIKSIEKGEGVSYGLTFIADNPTSVALVPIGYADGVNRRLSNNGQVCVRGVKASIIGRICMDQLMIDVTEIDGVEVGDEVVLIGSQGTAGVDLEEWAAIVGTINYELACNINKRVPRALIENG